MKGQFGCVRYVNSVSGTSVAGVCPCVIISPIADTALLLAVSICLIIRLIAPIF